MRNILILSAYDADSHKRWYQGLVRYLSEENPEDSEPFNFTVLTLPARFFSWRIRGNALSWAVGQRALLESQQWDAIVATSMVDLATLKGLVPCLSGVPTCVYFHENQFAYPVTEHSHKSIEPQMVTLYSALAADRVCFNSTYNKSTFLCGVQALLKKLPDQIPEGIVTRIEQKAQVLPVPIELDYFALNEGASESQVGHVKNPIPSGLPVTIVWNHRWEYDKCPELLLLIVELLSETDSEFSFRWHIVGQSFRQVPKAFDQLRALLEEKNWLGEWGYLTRPAYLQVLAHSHIALSTAKHDFQGLAVMDAVAAGCIPLLPNRVAYPNFFDAKYLFGDEGEAELSVLATHAVNKILFYCSNTGAQEAPSLERLSWPNMKMQYIQMFNELAT